MRPTPGWYHVVRGPELLVAGRPVRPDDVLQLRLPDGQAPLAVRLAHVGQAVRMCLRIGGEWERVPRGQERLPTEVEAALPLDAELRWGPSWRR